ncbi:winged helix-turn-helix domain-containing protein [Pseudomonas rubra]|uniref:Winged helix-turn-helix domain-containing protein n=1 Tax=Pseudomonas rubra TaxID=2942627 RepID=A0ABT5PCH1_9PSED|nr:winged helix-turn-helix domain-containing protein [Pseudomonas rubra]MDD1016001.1 winged helix-turn-helix domain-containing protein [Pseudomonas rubra]MDD1039228.1 winged helix-turn-helix domain-containing protein [Pseudomonas rubra]MDD1155198.1 winged helix-turn-helix domain-containing protein [Pseudomonas rubra]
MTAFVHAPENVHYYFGYWCLCPEGVLWHNESGQHLPPKELQVLRLLLANPGMLISKDRMLSAVWPGLDTAEESLTRCISVLRKLLKDCRQFIVTVYGKGYRFNCRVQRTAGIAEQTPLKPTLAILPFRGGQSLETLVLNTQLKCAAGIALEQRAQLLSLSVASLSATPLETLALIERLAPSHYLCGYCVQGEHHWQLTVELVRGNDHRVLDCRLFRGTQTQVIEALLAFLQACFPLTDHPDRPSSEFHQDPCLPRL